MPLPVQKPRSHRAQISLFAPYPRIGRSVSTTISMLCSTSLCLRQRIAQRIAQRRHKNQNASAIVVVTKGGGEPRVSIAHESLKNQMPSHLFFVSDEKRTRPTGKWSASRRNWNSARPFASKADGARPTGRGRRGEKPEPRLQLDLEESRAVWLLASRGCFRTRLLVIIVCSYYVVRTHKVASIWTRHRSLVSINQAKTNKCRRCQAKHAVQA
ncbi:hypothetical protein B0T22DRAFT_233336 [Podospora appendiculata]|uniref:Uncharacterized protein n=1 Tax=Podospora appendiculata TaxID=314037 RepID=A0AAE1CAR9_9PEZI|nr:hypothetical protein B0T22DRAFT_233336 [Podospora appendiculata]